MVDSSRAQVIANMSTNPPAYAGRIKKVEEEIKKSKAQVEQGRV
jgi:hypothetical protein